MAEASALDLKQSRKWQITINNPLEHGFTDDSIKALMSSVRGASLYWCMCHEEGDECETDHIHVFIFRNSPFTARQINNLFPNMHRETAFGTCAENRAYVLKDGEKFNKDESGHYDYTDKKGKRHIGINHSDTFYEYGQCPDEHQGKSTTSELVLQMIKQGASNEDILDICPSAYKDLEKIERVRSEFLDADFKLNWRDLYVTYILCATGTGKNRSVMEKYGYENCYRVTDYNHPFDAYEGEDVIIFEEFRGGIKHGDMLNYLDGYPVRLPARYFNRQAAFTKVFFTTNIPPEEQYSKVDVETRHAFWRRIHKVIQFHADGSTSSFDGVEAYIHRFDWVEQAAHEQPQMTL